MAVLLGSKWTSDARRMVNEAVDRGMIPNAELTLGYLTEQGCYVIAYERPLTRGNKAGSTTFYALLNADEGLAVTKLTALPRPEVLV